MKKYNVAVLMSTFNGEKYIREQIDSLLGQKSVDINIYIRDDGSSDDTLKILEEYKKNIRIHIIYGSNLGPTKSFWTLLMNDINADYFAFSDQDDVWFENKLLEACSKLERCEKEAMYFSNLYVVDEKLEHQSILDMTPNLNIGSALVSNRAYGCTIVINKKLCDIIKRTKSTMIPQHDTKIYHIALAIGAEIYFDKKSYILYRQHGSNVVGAKISFVKRNISRIKRIIIYQKHERRDEARSLLNDFGEMISAENKYIIGRMAFPGKIDSRLKTIKDKRFRTGNKKVDRDFQISMLLKLV